MNTKNQASVTMFNTNKFVSHVLQHIRLEALNISGGHVVPY